MAIEFLTSSNFDEVINEGVTLVDFYADWCMPCKMVAPVLEELVTEIPDVKIKKINVDENRDIAMRYGVMSIPTMILFKNGEIASKAIGFQPKPALAKWINNNK